MLPDFIILYYTNRYIYIFIYIHICIYRHNFDPVDDAADRLQREECDYDSDNEAAVEWRGLVRDAEDEGPDLFPDAMEEDFGVPLEENAIRLEVEIQRYEKWRNGADCSNKRFCGNSRPTFYRKMKSVAENEALDSKAAKEHLPMSHYFVPQGDC
jgi:hypothetical protein